MKIRKGDVCGYLYVENVAGVSIVYWSPIQAPHAVWQVLAVKSVMKGGQA